MGGQSRVRFISLALVVPVFAVWAIFYVIILGDITNGAEKQITLAANQIIARLGGEFLEAERLSYNLKHNADIQALLTERDIGDSYRLAERTAGAFAPELSGGFIDCVILYGADKNAYQLSGALGNKSYSRLHGIISGLELPHHLTATLDGKKYIGYADEIPLDGTDTAGAAVVLTEEEKVLEILRSYDQSGSLLVVVRANGETVTANTDRAAGIDGLSTVVRGGLGVTPYEISVAADGSYMNATLVSFAIVALITSVIFASVLVLFNRLESKNAEVLAAETGKQKALVVSLRKQINAHFTVNTMGAIRTAVNQGELDKAETLMSGLTRIVRYAHSEDEKINIWDEEEILRYYTSIMSVRYGGKLTAEFLFDEDLMETAMPRMLLQPLMENAVEHGFKDMDSGCVITVKAELRGGIIRFTVSDNGCGMGEEELSALNERLNSVPGSLDGLENIALLNIRNRLYYYYGKAAGMGIKRGGGGGIEVTIEIPSGRGIGGAL